MNKNSSDLNERTKKANGNAPKGWGVNDNRSKLEEGRDEMMLRVGIQVVLDDGNVSHGYNIEDCKDEILRKIGEEIDDRVVNIMIKKRPMQNTSVGEVTTTENFSNH